MSPLLSRIAVIADLNSVHDAPRPDEIALWIGYATGPRVNARCKGPDQKEVDALIASFGNS